MPTFIRTTLFSLAVVAVSSTARAAPVPSPADYVSREEYEKLLHEQEELRAEIDAMKRERAVASPATLPTEPATSATPATPSLAPESAPWAKQADLDDANESVRQLKEDVARYHTADSRFTLVGDAALSYSSLKGSPSTFSATISPLVLWQPSDLILIEAAADINIATDRSNNSGTTVDLKIGNASFLINDYLAVGGGLFVVPFGQFHNHFDPPWINEFPSDPLAFDAIAPDSEVGAFAKGAIPFTVADRGLKATYDFYVTNGPNLITNDAGQAGGLNFSDFTDLNGNKAVGGRLGFLPVSNLELGYSVQVSRPGAGRFGHVNALLEAIDLNWRQDVPALSGWIDLRGEYVWSHVGQINYDPHHTLGFGPVNFVNNREGGYVQVAYRPAYWRDPVLRNFEIASRYDFLNTPLQSPGGDHEHRLSLGLDYWITPSTVLETAYQFDRRHRSPSDSGLIIQLGLRF